MIVESVTGKSRLVTCDLICDSSKSGVLIVRASLRLGTVRPLTSCESPCIEIISCFFSYLWACFSRAERRGMTLPASVLRSA